MEPLPPAGVTLAAPPASTLGLSTKRKRGAEEEEEDEGHHEEAEDGQQTYVNTSASSWSSTYQPLSSSSSAPFESIVQDEARYRTCRHAPVSAEAAEALKMRAKWVASGGGGVGGTGANQQRFGEEAVRRKQAELDRTNHLYKALARKSFQLSVTLLTDPNNYPPDHTRPSMRHPLPSHATTPSSASAPSVDICRTVVLPAAIPLSKLHKTLQMMLGWEDTQKYQFMTKDGVPIAKYNKDEMPCLSDSKIRLAYIVKDSGDEFYYQYGEWLHRLVVETIGAPRRNIPSTRVISGTGQCPPEDSSPGSYAAAVAEGRAKETRPFSVDAVNAQLMAGQTFYMRIPASASKEQEEYVCLRAMRTPVNILSTSGAATTSSQSQPQITDASPSWPIAATTVKPEPSPPPQVMTAGSMSSSSSSSAIRSSSPTTIYSSPTLSGLPSMTSSPPGPAQVRPVPQPAYANHYRHPATSSLSTAVDRYTSSSPSASSEYSAALMSLPPSASLPGHYYPSYLQHHDLATWRDEAVDHQQQRHLSAPSFLPSTSTSSTQPGGVRGGLSFGMMPGSTSIHSLPPSFSSSLSTSSSFSYPDGDDAQTEEFYARGPYPPPAYLQHQNQNQPYHQGHYQQPLPSHQYASHYHHDSSHQSQKRSSLPSSPHSSTTTTTTTSSLAPSPSHGLLPFPSHTLPPFLQLSSSSPSSSLGSSSSRRAVGSRSPSPPPLFPPSSSLSSSLGFYTSHDLSHSAERLPPLSATGALAPPEPPPTLYSAGAALPPFQLPMPSLTSFSSSSSPSGHHHPQEHQSQRGLIPEARARLSPSSGSPFPSPRSSSLASSSSSFPVPASAFPPSFATIFPTTVAGGDGAARSSLRTDANNAPAED